MLLPFLVSTLLTVLPASPSIGEPSAPPETPAPTTTVENVFLPDDTTVNVTDCISSVQRPECGSRERGGWRQGVLFGVVVAGLIAIGSRLVIGIRRRPEQERPIGRGQTGGRDA
jgi:hypothetical protein